MLISVGWLPPYWCPSRRLLRSRLEGRGLVTRSKIAPKTGAASPPMARDRDQRWFAPSPGWAAELRRHRDRSGDGPSERRHLPRNRDDNLVHMFAARAQQPVPLAQPQLGLPRDGAHLGGYVLQAELEMSTHFRWIPIGPGSLDEGPPGVTVPRLGDAALAPSLPRRVLRRRQAQVAHQLPRRIEPGQAARFGDQSHRAGKIHPPQGLDSFHDRMQPPRLHGRVQLDLQALDSLRLLGHGVDVLLEHDLLRRRRADHPRQPAQMGGVPVRAPLVANVLAQQERLQPHLAHLKSRTTFLRNPPQSPNPSFLNKGT